MIEKGSFRSNRLHSSVYIRMLHIILNIILFMAKRSTCHLLFNNENKNGDIYSLFVYVTAKAVVDDECSMWGAQLSERIRTFCTLSGFALAIESDRLLLYQVMVRVNT